MFYENLITKCTKLFTLLSFHKSTPLYFRDLLDEFQKIPTFFLSPPKTAGTKKKILYQPSFSFHRTKLIIIAAIMQ